MSNIEFTVQRRDSRYVLVVRRYGIVVWADDVASGIKEVESRVEDVVSYFRDAGITDEQVVREQADHDQLAALRLFLVKTAFVFLLIIALIIGMFVVVRSATEPLVAAITHPFQFLVRVSDDVDSMSPERMEQLKQAVCKIAAKVGPLVDEAKGALKSESQSGDKVDKPKPQTAQ